MQPKNPAMRVTAIRSMVVRLKIFGNFMYSCSLFLGLLSFFLFFGSFGFLFLGFFFFIWFFTILFLVFVSPVSRYLRRITVGLLMSKCVFSIFKYVSLLLLANMLSVIHNCIIRL